MIDKSGIFGAKIQSLKKRIGLAITGKYDIFGAKIHFFKTK